ncbi:MAG: hypothetical protein UU77_C0013G0012 [candidate division WWE3 bacterium GW2011_GWC1_41_7]|uniref:Uncharacterized protein n=3 Tax=Katanobacteria TaxID=422282 RepID=A0A0G0X933_UNCKA|nr:MAG: hypothetical protein UU72_C0019G0012 [candidate division WWE3 bacterium GW2011_GWB1_41_6]KKS20897.1 MAG: hypothetical protein UU77_C0013G0012 [candidate division WWE3 bacterium GW2011_GWC1_41_7]KKS21878.1 MAG: hypothetical protein UU80_C0018G0014 [candidate division WWE3 bacterium GW2011_GWA1_41_8]
MCTCQVSWVICGSCRGISMGRHDITCTMCGNRGKVSAIVKPDPNCPVHGKPTTQENLS